MSKRHAKASYWQDAPMPREQLVLVATMLEDRIPEDHPVRILDGILDRLSWSDWEAKYHGGLGQPPIHPRILCKVLLFAMIRRIRSSRQIEYSLKHSIDFMWLASGRVIDHVTLSNFRRKHPQELKKLYREMIQLAMNLGLAKLSELCIDGTRVLANANKYKTWTAGKVERLLAELDTQIAHALSELDTNDELEELFDTGIPADKLPENIRDMKLRHAQLDEVLTTLREMEAMRAKLGTDPQKNPAQLPITDQDSRILPNKEGGYAPNYTPMAVTETCHGFIVGADVMIGNVEHDQLVTLTDTIASDFGVRIERALVDTAYTTGPNLTAMEEREIELLGPLNEPKCKTNPAQRSDLSEPVAESELAQLPINPQTKCFDKTAFVYEEASDSYYCPAGKQLNRRGSEVVDRGGEKVRRTVYASRHCAGCPLAAMCRPKPDAKKGREIADDVHEQARRRHRERMKTPEAQANYSRRQHFGETPFAVLKTLFDMRRFLLRGIEGVKQEWLWGCTAFNLKKLTRLIGEARRLARETEMKAAA